MLTTTSSVLLVLTRTLMHLRAGLPTLGPATGGEREGPHFERCVSTHVPTPIPRWTGRLHMAVASPAVIAFANSFMARHPQSHARWFSRGSCNEANRFTRVAARTIASPHQQGTFTVELSLGGSPHPNVDYNYAGKQPIPATGLAPVRHTSVWAAKGRHECRKRAGMINR